MKNYRKQVLKITYNYLTLIIIGPDKAKLGNIICEY